MSEATAGDQSIFSSSIPILSAHQEAPLALFTISGDNIFAFIFTLAAIALVVRGLAWNQVKALLARGWLTHQGRVEFGNVEARRMRYKDLYIARIDYSYSVN